MPLYEFRCPSGHDFEKFYRSISSAPSEEKCPECGELAARVMSVAGLSFKGTGFYITDYGKDGKKNDAVAPKPAAASTPAPTSEAKSETKTDAKPATTESKPAAPAKKAE
jgi:putative FmdB family regulatory protein